MREDCQIPEESLPQVPEPKHPEVYRDIEQVTLPFRFQPLGTRRPKREAAWRIQAIGRHSGGTYETPMDGRCAAKDPAQREIIGIPDFELCRGTQIA
jgi:hypothetical protein